ncbi:hypothetical protein NM688_g5680 [Phlebia brevispora]|uniref:Uncharacterized protein n=1 Tax=Phlebia brevispora TaxID=194682 RepID=A0ACC1SRP2_9APHY|nr:hypothetical protein NM688_g5680 [Phlebia brevispora]
MSEARTQRAIKWYPPAYDIRVEEVPIPSIQHPDDAIVKIQLAGLCGSDLHVYRGHEDVDAPLICGHEFIGTVVELGSSFTREASGRPDLYATLQIGDKVVSPFTVSCEECQVGFTCRCVHSILFGIPSLPGGQAQYVRVPKAGGTLFKVDSIAPPSSVLKITDSSLLLLADILPTGVFAALQALQHAKLSPMIAGVPYPASSSFLTGPGSFKAGQPIPAEDRALVIAIVGLGPVGVCAFVSLLDMLEALRQQGIQTYRIVAIDPIASRRQKLQDVLAVISASSAYGDVAIEDIESGKKRVQEWTGGFGCNSVLEIVGNNSALKLAYELVRPFGTISSVGVHQEPPLPFMGRDMYNKKRLL